MKTISIKMPVAQDEFGRWLERNNVQVSYTCTFGKYDVTIAWKKVHSYSDENGSREERWSISRHGEDLAETLWRAVEAAMRIQRAS